MVFLVNLNINFGNKMKIGYGMEKCKIIVHHRIEIVYSPKSSHYIIVSTLYYYYYPNLYLSLTTDTFKNSVI